MVQENEPWTQISNKTNLRQSLKSKCMNKICNINFFYYLLKGRLEKTFFLEKFFFEQAKLQWQNKIYFLDKRSLKRCHDFYAKTRVFIYFLLLFFFNKFKGFTCSKGFFL